MRVFIDKELLDKAQIFHKTKTKKAIVEDALRLLIAVKSQENISKLRGNIALDEEAFK